MTARILVVDDILANVKLLEARLSAEYFEVLTAYSGREALEVLATRPVDVVLLDVMMPGMDGFEVCRRIKSDPKTTHVPVIMVSALDQTSDKIQGLKAGADDFLTKPVDASPRHRVKNLARLRPSTTRYHANCRRRSCAAARHWRGLGQCRAALILVVETRSGTCSA
jgi:two-component system cell cycle response regulator